MKDQDKTKQQLIAENEELLRRVAAMEGVEAERSRAAEELRRSEAKWRSLVGNMPLFTAVIDRSGKIEFHNDCYQPGHTPENVIGRVIYDFIQPEYHELARECLERVFNTGKPTFYESVGSGPNGALSSYEVHISPIIVDGEVVVAALISRDITDRKQADEALSQSEQRLSLHFQQTPLGAIEWDLNFKVTRWNPGADRIFGYSKEEALGRYASFIVPPIARELVDQVWNDLLLRKGGERSTNENVTKDGRTILSEWYNTPLVDADGNVIGVASLVDDITDRKRAEEALRESKRTLRTLMDASPESILLMDTAGTILLANETVARRFGRSVDEITGRIVYDLLPPEVAANRRMHVEEVVCTGKPIRFEDSRFSRNVENAVYPILDKHGQVAALAVLGIDQTDRKRAEKALQQAHDELERRVEERTAELSKANDQLRIFQQFAETSGQGFSMADLGGHLLYMNPALCRMLGEDKPHGRIGQHISIYYPDEVNRTRETERFPVLMRDGYWQGELPMLSCQGKLIPTWHSTFVIRDESGKPFRIAVVITDISERKRAEAALQTSEEKYRTLVETSPDGVIIADLKGHVTYASGPVLEYFGAERVEDLLGRNPLDFIAKEDHHRFLDNLRRTVEEGTTRDIDYTFLKKDGTHFPGEISAAVIRDASGKPNSIVAILRDITERHRAQEALGKSEMKYRQLVETTGTGYLILDGHGRVIDANAEYIRISGHRTLEEILGRTVVEWTAPYDVDRNAKEVERCFRQGFVWQLEIDYIHSDGKIIPIDINATCLDTENGRQIVCLCRDITERRQAQEALRTSEERFRAFMDNNPAVAWAKDEEGRHVYLNRTYERRFGVQLEDWRGKTDVELWPPETARQFRENDLAVLTSGKVVQVTEESIEPDGIRCWWWSFKFPFEDASGKKYVGGVGIDITERKRAEAALERERQSLWKMLQASDHERQIISYDIHDGLAQYLAAAGMQFQAHDSLRDNSPDEARKAYETAVELVRQAHAESRRLINEVRPPVIDENGIETAISHLVHEQRRHGGPKIEFDSDVQFDRLPSILENALYRIAQEAMTNACKHSKSKAVKVTLNQEGQDVRLEVQDWGIGFDPEAVEKGHFGLEGIRQRVRLLGGRLTIDSKPGFGTLVQVVVPIVERKGEG